MYNESLWQDGNDNHCAVCGAEIDFSASGWQETDPGIVCADCVNAAKGADNG